MCTEVIFSKLFCNVIEFKFTYFFLIFFKFGKGNIKALIHMFIPKELDSSLVHFPCVGKVTMFFFKAGVLDPVLNIRVHKHKYRGIKETPGDTMWLKKKTKQKAQTQNSNNAIYDNGADETRTKAKNH